MKVVPQGRIELPTSPLPRVRSATELLRRAASMIMLERVMMQAARIASLWTIACTLDIYRDAESKITSRGGKPDRRKRSGKGGTLEVGLAQELGSAQGADKNQKASSVGQRAE